MTRRLAILLAAGAGVLAWCGAGNAAANVEFGSNCQGETGIRLQAAVSLKHGKGNPLPVTAPISGVIVQWVTEVGPAVLLSPSLTPRLLVIRAIGQGPFFRIAAESPSGEPLHFGINTFNPRLPVPIEAGDTLGLAGAETTLLCHASSSSDEIGAFPPYRAGTTFAPTDTGYSQVPVSASIEPDADGDGYGDESQDRCPQGAAFQSKCPVVTLRPAYTVGPNAVTVRVTANRTTPVEVFASFKLGNGSLAVGLRPRRVAAGKDRAFRIVLPNAVRATVADLSPGESLPLLVGASADGVRGSVSSDRLRVRLTALG